MDEQIILSIIAVIAIFLAGCMVFSKNILTAALCLLGILICTAGIYGLIGEHFVAAVQLVVYAGAVMMLFIFSIMLLNLRKDERLDFRLGAFSTLVAFASVLSILFVLFMGFSNLNYSLEGNALLGDWTREKMSALGGNSTVLAYALFSEHYLSFEVISLALLVALVGGVVLAKRKID